MKTHGPHPKTDAERLSRFLASQKRAYEKRKIRLEELRGDPDFWARGAVTACRTRAREKNVPFAIEQADVRALYRETCECCEGRLVFQAKRDRQGPAWDSASVDRLRPEAGYVLGNLALVCMACNTIKGNAQNNPTWLRSIADYIEARQSS